MEQQNNKIIAKPFVKWAGGKGALIKQLVNYLPNDIEEQQNVTYIGSSRKHGAYVKLGN